MVCGLDHSGSQPFIYSQVGVKIKVCVFIHTIMYTHMYTVMTVPVTELVPAG